MASRGFARRAAMLGQRYRSAQPSATYGLDRDAGTASALAGKSGREVFRGWLVFKLLTYDWIINNSLTLYRVSKSLLGLRLTERLLRATVGGQFLGGFSEQETARVADTLATRNICSLWNYSVEQDLSDGDDGGSEEEVVQQERTYDKVNNIYLRSIELSGKHNYQASPVKPTAVKMTAIVQPHLLLKLSQMLVSVQALARQHQGRGDLSELSPAGEQRRAEATEWLSQVRVPENVLRLQEVCQAGGLGVTPFSDLEKEQLTGLVKRLDDMAECAREEGVRILMDAEESRLQPAIHHLTVHHMMQRYNNTQPTIYNTIQMYLKGSFEALLMDIAAAKKAGFLYGIKMVRGAYMEMERETAANSGLEYPIHPDQAATDCNYIRGMRHTMEEIARGGSVGGMVVASHNQETVEQALQTMHELEIQRESGAVCFGQVLGMGDHLTYPLAKSGCIVLKFVPYGDMEQVVPYLVRRGQENNIASRNAQLERRLYAEALTQRLRQ